MRWPFVSFSLCLFLLSFSSSFRAIKCNLKTQSRARVFNKHNKSTRLVARAIKLIAISDYTMGKDRVEDFDTNLEYF